MSVGQVQLAHQTVTRGACSEAHCRRQPVHFASRSVGSNQQGCAKCVGSCSCLGTVATAVGLGLLGFIGYKFFKGKVIHSRLMRDGAKPMACRRVILDPNKTVSQYGNGYKLTEPFGVKGKLLLTHGTTNFRTVVGRHGNTYFTNGQHILLRRGGKMYRLTKESLKQARKEIRLAKSQLA